MTSTPKATAKDVLAKLHLLEPATSAKRAATQAVDRVAAARSGGGGGDNSGGRDVDLADLWSHAGSNWYYDVLTVAVIRKVLQPGDLAVDIGAHTGEVLQHMVGASPGVTHVAIEPLPHLAADLRLRFSGVEVHEVALVEEPSGPLQFHHVASNPGYSGILQRSFDRPSEEVELIEVESARLDDVVGPDRTPKLIKLDVEGAELGVLKGASRILSDAKPIVVFEHGEGAANHYDTTPRAVFDLFDGHAYDLFLLGTWLESGPPLDRDQFAAQYEQQRNYYFLAAPRS